MKFNKTKLKKIIKEEVEALQKEGIFDFFKKKKKEEPAPEPEPEAPSEEELKAQAIERIKDSIYMPAESIAHIDYFNKPGFDGKNGLRGAFTGNRMKFGHYAADGVADKLGKLYRLADRDLYLAVATAIYSHNSKADEEYIRGVVDTLVAAAKDRYEYMKRDVGSYNPSSRKSEFDKWQSGEGDNYNYMTRMEEKKEMKLTKEKLKQIIKEELNNIMKKEGLDQGEKDDLASLKSKEKALAAKRSKNDSNALKDEHDALKDKIKALKDKEHQ